MPALKRPMLKSKSAQVEDNLLKLLIDIHNVLKDHPNMTIDDINLTKRAEKAGLSSAPTQDVFYDECVDLYHDEPTMEMAQHVHVLMNNQKLIVRRHENASPVQVTTSEDKDAEIERLRGEIMVLRNVLDSRTRPIPSKAKKDEDAQKIENQKREIERLRNALEVKKERIGRLLNKIDRLRAFVDELVSPMADASKKIMEVYEIYRGEKFDEETEDTEEGAE